MKIGQRETFWLLRAQSGDLEAEDLLFRTIQEPLFRYVLSVVRQRPAALDVLQEVFLRIHRKLGWLRDPQLFAPWAYRIATNEAMRFLAKEKRVQEREGDEEVEPVATPEEAPPFDREQLNAAIEELPARSRAAIALFYLEELPISEVAAVLEIPVGTVKSRLAYGREALRRYLEKNHAQR